MKIPLLKNLFFFKKNLFLFAGRVYQLHVTGYHDSGPAGNYEALFKKPIALDDMSCQFPEQNSKQSLNLIFFVFASTSSLAVASIPIGTGKK